MKTITIRGIDEATMAAIKREAREHAVSMNSYILETLKKAAGTHQVMTPEHHDLDGFFGTWNEANYREVVHAVNSARAIDKELWQ